MDEKKHSVEFFDENTHYNYIPHIYVVSITIFNAKLNIMFYISFYNIWKP